MARLNKIRMIPFAKFQAILLVPVGLVTGIVYSFGGLIFDVITTDSVNMGTALAFLALIGMPVVFGVSGFILGILEALLYNLFAKWIGSLNVDFN